MSFRFYVAEKTLGVENAQCIQRLITSGQGPAAVREIVAFSVDNRAPKQDTILFALAMCARSSYAATQKAAYEAVNAVCRIPTHLFTFMEYCQLLSKPKGRGHGRAHRRAISTFYTSKQGSQLSFLCTKFNSRNGWSHRDLLRVMHVQPTSPAHELLFHYLVKGFKSASKLPCVEQAAALPASDVPLVIDVTEADDSAASSTTTTKAADAADAADAGALELRKTLTFLQALESLKAMKTAEEVAAVVQQHRLAREHIPTQFLNSTLVWEALLIQMPLNAMIRNLGKMTTIGLLAPGNAHTATVVAKLADADQLHRSRVHPFSVLLALRTYEQGRGELGKLHWEPVHDILHALNDAFYAAFANVVPTNKRFLLAIDVSGSMEAGNLCGSQNITPRVASAAMAMVTARTEPQSRFMAFSGGFVPLNISARDSLEDVMDTMNGMPFDSTDCSLPMCWALEQKLEVDVFVVYTDSETYAGEMHPIEALRAYRTASGIDAKLIVVGMTATDFTIADPSDTGMLDVVGFDAAAPEVMASFVSGAF